MTRWLQEIKPLPWKDTSSNGLSSFQADTVLGRFTYGIDRDGRAYWQDPDGEHEEMNLMAARASATNSFEGRVVAAFFVSRQTVDDVKAMQLPLAVRSRDGGILRYVITALENHHEQGLTAAAFPCQAAILMPVAPLLAEHRIEPMNLNGLETI